MAMSFSYMDQLEEFERALYGGGGSSDSRSKRLKPGGRHRDWFPEAGDPFETSYLLCAEEDKDDFNQTDIRYGYDGQGGQLLGGGAIANPANGTFFILLSNLTSAICATILLHSSVRAWIQPSHYLLCLTGLLSSSIVLTNTAMSLLAVCMLKRCKSRVEQGTSLLKMHHSLSLFSILQLLTFSSILARFWGQTDLEFQDTFYVPHYVTHINRSWMIFLCLLTTVSVSLGVVGNLHWPHWRVHHAGVLRWTMFSCSLIASAMGVVIVGLRVCLLFWLHTTNTSELWGLNLSAAAGVLLLVLSSVSVFAQSAAHVKVFILAAPVVALVVLVASAENVANSVSFIVSGQSETVPAQWLIKACQNSYCADAVFAAGAAGLSSIFFIIIGLVCAITIRPYFLDGTITIPATPAAENSKPS